LDKNFNGNRKKFLFSIYGSLIAAFALLVDYTFRTSPYRWERILVFINPQRDPNGAGYLNMILNKLLSSAKFFGKSDALINISGNSSHSFPGAIQNLYLLL
jgi:cell division protein FtsW (lipid II flippase)